MAGYIKGCSICGKVFNTYRKEQKYCGVQCYRHSQIGRAFTPKTATQEPCAFCKRPFWTTPFKKAKGERFCSRPCYQRGKAEEIEERKASRICLSPGCERKDISARGLCNAHYQRWATHEGPRSQRFNGKCPHCTKEFFSHTPKEFCSFQCYVKSDKHKVIMAHQRELSAEARGVVIGKREQIQCLNCGKIRDLHPGRASEQRFCSRACYRLWFAKRYDRWFATPETVALPQGYDEFLTQLVLPCLVDGCGWEGKHLSIHMNQAHGCPAQEFKRLAGFNAGTGVVSLDTHMALVESNAGTGDPNMSEHIDLEAIVRTRGPMRLEGKEHLRKAMAELRQRQKAGCK